jgi:hypothetical protein
VSVDAINTMLMATAHDVPLEDAQELHVVVVMIIVVALVNIVVVIVEGSMTGTTVQGGGRGSCSSSCCAAAAATVIPPMVSIAEYVAPPYPPCMSPLRCQTDKCHCLPIIPILSIGDRDYDLGWWSGMLNSGNAVDASVF